MRLVSARRCRPAAWPRVTTPGAICPVRLTGLPGGPTSPGSLPLVQGRASGVVAMAEWRRVDVGEGIAQERVDAVRLARTADGVYWRDYRRTWDDAFEGIGEGDLVANAYL